MTLTEAGSATLLFVAGLIDTGSRCCPTSLATDCRLVTFNACQSTD